MKLNEAFPSAFFKASDFEDGDRTLTIKSVDLEEIGKGDDKSTKPVISFRGEDKKFVCNKTNATTIAKVLNSDDTDDWIGQRITLGQREVEFKGEQMMSVRVSLKKPAAATAKPSTDTEASPFTDDSDQF